MTPTLDYNAGAATAPPRYSRGLHAVALLTAVATFPLIFMGGLVTSHGAGMSVPDWPNSFGYNMFLFPPGQWVGGIFYEHTHRLMGTVVGICSIALALLAWGPASTASAQRRIGFGVLASLGLATACVVLRRLPAISGPVRNLLPHLATGFAGLVVILLLAYVARRRHESRPWARWLTIGLLAAVIFQGVLGGLRVVLVELDLAIVHACFAQAFFCLAALAAVVTSRWWHEAADRASGGEAPAGRATVKLAAVVVGVVYLQLVVGAVMRHYNAGLAIPDLPLAYGKLLPPVNAAQLEAVNWDRVMTDRLPRVTLLQVWLHFGHRIGALAVTAAAAALLWTVFRRLRHEAALFRPAVLLAGLLVVQIILGVCTVLYRKPADLASAHVAAGALVLVTAFVLAIRGARLYSRPARTGPVTDGRAAAGAPAAPRLQPV